MAKDNETKGSSLRLVDGVLLVALGVVGVLVAFWALSFIAGIIWGFVKVAILIAVIALVVYLLLGRRSSKS